MKLKYLVLSGASYRTSASHESLVAIYRSGSLRGPSHNDSRDRWAVFNVGRLQLPLRILVYSTGFRQYENCCLEFSGVLLDQTLFLTG